MSKLSIAIIVVMLLLGSVSLFGNNIFESADSFDIALSKANTKRKLLLTYAAKSTTPSCIAMEKATFQNQEVQDLLKFSFYPIKINLSDSLGKKWIKKFQIVNSPTLLFFDNHGTLIKQVENGVSSNELKYILKEVVFFNINGYWPIESHPVVLTATVISQPTIAASKAIEVRSSSNKNNRSDSNYKISILIDQIPIGDATIKKTVERIKLLYPNQPLRIKLAKVNQKAFYNVLLGKFNDFKKAELLLTEIMANNFPKAELFLLDLKKP